MSFEKVEIGTATLYHGDAFDILPTLEDDSIHCVASDFPYGITNHTWDQVPPLDLTWRLLEAKSKDNANYVLFGAGGFTIDLINSKRDWFRYSMAWVKNNKTGHLNAGLMPMRNKEDIIVFGKPGHQKTAVFNVPDGFPQPSDVLVCPHERGNNQQGKNYHVTQKPVLLMGHLLLMYSNPGDLILDSFMGSGSTGVAAMKLGRRFVGIEKDEKFFSTACQRLEEIWQRKTARRLTYLSLSSNQPNADSTATEEESAIPVAPEAEHQNRETPKPTEELQ